jgi:hypothetical protein
MRGLRFPTIGEVDSRVRAAWQSQVAAAKQTPGLLPLLTRQRHELLPRFAAFYHQLRRLPRRLRRHWQRRGRQALAGVALLLALGQGLALAAKIQVDKIQVDGITCTLINAIVTANSDVNTGGCVQLPSATAGADRIVLQHRSVHTLTEVNNVTYEATGLPVVTSEITIKGSGSTIERSSAAPDFRILAVSHLGKLTLKHTTISGGVASGPSGGGGIFNLGTLAPGEEYSIGQFGQRRWWRCAQQGRGPSGSAG